MRSLIETSYQNVVTQLPILRGVRFDFPGGKFVQEDGTEVTDSRIQAVAGTADVRRARAGEATIKGALATQSLLRAADSEGGGCILEQLDRLYGGGGPGIPAGDLPAAIGGLAIRAPG
jgi:hypothetical protein